MQIDITEFFYQAEHSDYSASAAEKGPDASKITWAAACAEGADKPLLNTPKAIQALRDFMRGFGAWSREEIDAWTDDECNALFIQYISGHIREIEALCLDDDGKVDWAEVNTLQERGTIGAHIWNGADGRIYFDLTD